VALWRPAIASRFAGRAAAKVFNSDLAITLKIYARYHFSNGSKSDLSARIWRGRFYSKTRHRDRRKNRLDLMARITEGDRHSAPDIP
jgi:hypothetical protein